MYGKKHYRQIIKQTDPIAAIDSSIPTFVCSKCNQVRPLSPGHIDVHVTVENKTKLSCRLCWGCSVLLEAWMKK
jgi:hypothetical protein